jgi:hypothetical protein
MRCASDVASFEGPPEPSTSGAAVSPSARRHLPVRLGERFRQRRAEIQLRLTITNVGADPSLTHPWSELSLWVGQFSVGANSKSFERVGKDGLWSGPGGHERLLRGGEAHKKSIRASGSFGETRQAALGRARSADFAGWMTGVGEAAAATRRWLIDSSLMTHRN